MRKDLSHREVQPRSAIDPMPGAATDRCCGQAWKLEEMPGRIPQERGEHRLLWSAWQLLPANYGYLDARGER